MFRLGLHLTLRSGREGLVRLLVTTVAVAVGVGLLLSVLAMFQAYRSTIDRPCWECTEKTSATGSLLWNYSQDYYGGATIERVDVAALSPGAPTMPGLAHLPAAGQYFASPALAKLLAQEPKDQLGARFPGALSGAIGAAALDGPDELVIVVGRPATELRALPRTIRISAVDTDPRGLGTSQFYRFGFALGTVALLVPMMVLIGNATRIAAARREERYAAMRLVGATRRQIGLFASMESIAGAAAGAVLGIGLYELLRPGLTRIPLLGYRFFPQSITPTGWGIAGAVIVVPVAAALAGLIALRRVGISPLGVSRRVTPPAPRAWRIIPLVVGIGVFCVPLTADPEKQRHSPGLAVGSLLLVMLGLLVAGPWLSMMSARLLGRWSAGGSGLLAARRLADNPRAAFRAVSGLVLAVMTGTALAAIMPAAIASEKAGGSGSLNDVVRIGFVNGDRLDKGPDFGLAPADAAPVLAAVAAVRGADPIPLYHPSGGEGPATVVRCADLARLPALGTCPAGATTVLLDTGAIYTDNISALDRLLPLPTSPARVSDPSRLLLSDLLVRTDSAATLERVRTALSPYAGLVDPFESPMTFGEVGHVRAELYDEIQRVVTLVAALTMLIAGSGLAVAVASGLVERKRPFTLLRVSGTATRVLYRTVLLETVLPLLVATVVAFGVGLVLAYPIARALAPGRHAAVLPDAGYYLVLGLSLAAALAVIAACLPILGRLTATRNVRFE
jgi:putative flippase GtrA